MSNRMIDSYKINNLTLYKVDSKNRNFIDKLIDKDYIIIYDETILKEGNKWLLAPSTLNTKQYYKLIKKIYPYSFAVYNMAEVGFCSCKWYK